MRGFTMTSREETKFEQELDWESIVVGLLHDTFEDTNVVTFERTEEEFGSTVRHIVEGETKVLDPRNQQQQTQHLTFGAFIESSWLPSMATIPTSTTTTSARPPSMTTTHTTLHTELPWLPSMASRPPSTTTTHTTRQTELPWLTSMAARPPSTTTHNSCQTT
ncbi:hypothetical protein JHK87_044976 [Glycine soja]|nr:hypothetical protein JHK87_044976 [Glycine soja]